MTPAEITEAFDLIKAHSTALVHPLIDVVEAAWRLDREAIKVRDTQIALLGVHADNDQHSRKVAPLEVVR